VQKKGKVIEGTETEGSNSQVESEDSNFETPRALKRGAAPSAPFISTDNHSDTEDIVDQERVTASEYHESVTAASEYHESESDNQQQQSETESESDKNVQNLKDRNRSTSPRCLEMRMGRRISKHSERTWRNDELLLRRKGRRFVDCL